MAPASKKSVKDFLDWLTELQEQLKDINDLMPPGNQFQLFFRGMENVAFENIPSIYRDGFIKNEDVIFKECLCRNSDDFSKEKTTFDKLVKMQHYGIPTRLLDVTTNPLVALYFACRRQLDQNAAVHVFFVSQKAIKYSDSDTVSAVSNIALQPYSRFSTEGGEAEFEEYLALMQNGQVKTEDIASAYQKYIRAFNENAMGYLLHDIKQEKPHFQEIIDKGHLESIWCVKPKLNNNRIIRQDGAFLLFGVLLKKNIPLRIPLKIVAQKGIEIKKMFSELMDNYFGSSEPLSIDDQNKVLRVLAYSISSKEIKEIFKEPFKNNWENTDGIDVAESVYKAELRKQQVEAKRGLLKPFPYRKNQDNTEKRLQYENRIKNLSISFLSSSFYFNFQSNDNIIFRDWVPIANQAGIIKELEALGITEDKLFPELDHVAEYLKGKYKQAEEAK